MRMLHTADWHLCDKLGQHQRHTDLAQRVEVVANLCEEHAVDVLLVAGDLFYENISPEAMADALRHVNETFTNFFKRGGTILAITGNHDRDRHINMVRVGMSLAAPMPSGGNVQPGRMYLQSGPGYGTLQRNGETVQFVLLPFPTVHRYGMADDVHHSKEEQSRAFQQRIRAYLTSLIPEGKLQKQHPSVLIAHLPLSGVQLQTSHHLTEKDQVLIDDIALFDGFAYVALGDIHQPQVYKNLEHIRYSGSLDRLDFGERDNECGVVLIEIGPAGIIGSSRFLSIPATPFLQIDIEDAESELPQLAERYPQRDAAIVKVSVSTKNMNLTQDEVQKRLRAIFPRIFSIDFVEAERLHKPAEREWSPRKSMTETVREYLQHQLDGDDLKEEVLALAEQFLQEGA